MRLIVLRVEVHLQPPARGHAHGHAGEPRREPAARVSKPRERSLGPLLHVRDAPCQAKSTSSSPQTRLPPCEAPRLLRGGASGPLLSPDSARERHGEGREYLALTESPGSCVWLPGRAGGRTWPGRPSSRAHPVTFLGTAGRKPAPQPRSCQECKPATRLPLEGKEGRRGYLSLPRNAAAGTWAVGRRRPASHLGVTDGDLGADQGSCTKDAV